MPRQTLLHVDRDRADELASDPRFSNLYYRFPRDHPLMRHDGPSIYVMANTKRKRAYVCVAEKHTPAAVRAQLGRLRRYIRVDAGVARFGPKPGAMITNDGSLSLPDDLARDWSDGGPEAFTWHLVCPLPERYWLDPKFGQVRAGKREYTREYTHHLNRLRRDVIEKLQQGGWSVYNNVETRGMGIPGFRLAWLERREQLDNDLDEQYLNHTDWSDLADETTGLLRPEFDPMDRRVQLAYAREKYRLIQESAGKLLDPEAMVSLRLPSPGDPMWGHKPSDRPRYAQAHGLLRIGCPANCPRRTPDQVDTAEES